MQDHNSWDARDSRIAAALVKERDAAHWAVVSETIEDR